MSKHVIKVALSFETNGRPCFGKNAKERPKYYDANSPLLFKCLLIYKKEIRNFNPLGGV